VESNLVPIVAGIVVVLAVMCIPYAIIKDRRKKKERMIQRLPSYSFSPAGVGSQRAKELQNCLVKALKAVKAGDRSRALVEVDIAKYLFPDDAFGPVGTSRVTMINHERIVEFAEFLDLASKLPIKKDSEEAMIRLLTDAVKSCGWKVDNDSNEHESS
jgi:hypothetical protein